MVITNEIKVTTEILWKGALFFALVDVVFVSVLTRIIKPDHLFRMKWKLVILMAIFFCILFGSLVSIIFWDPVYSYVFPGWARWIIPPAYGLLFSLAGLLFWWLAFRMPFNPVMSFCVLGGTWGIATHVLAIYRGILEKPPMLQGASPLSALAIATFEFIFYWCICLSLTAIIERNVSRFIKRNS